MNKINIAVVGVPWEFKLFTSQIINQYGNINFISLYRNTDLLKPYELHSYILLPSAIALTMEKQKEIISAINSRIR